MKPSGPLARRARLRSRREAAPNNEELACREAVYRRSFGRCEMLCGAFASELHHRRTRSEKWSRWLPENCLDLCNGCHHGAVHGNVDWARRHGLILSRHSVDHPNPVVSCSADCPVDHLA